MFIRMYVHQDVCSSGCMFIRMYVHQELYGQEYNNTNMTIQLSVTINLEESSF